MGKRRRVSIVLLAYIALVAGATALYVNNFPHYTENEGEAEINYMEFLFFTSMIFQGAMYWMLKSINWKLAILSTIVNLLVSIGLTIIIIDWGEFSESAQQLIIIYSWCYMVIFSVVAWIQIRTAWV